MTTDGRVRRHGVTSDKQEQYENKGHTTNRSPSVTDDRFGLGWAGLGLGRAGAGWAWLGGLGELLEDFQPISLVNLIRKC